MICHRHIIPWACKWFQVIIPLVAKEMAPRTIKKKREKEKAKDIAIVKDD